MRLKHDGARDYPDAWKWVLIHPELRQHIDCPTRERALCLAAGLMGWERAEVDERVDQSECGTVWLAELKPTHSGYPYTVHERQHVSDPLALWMALDGDGDLVCFATCQGDAEDKVAEQDSEMMGYPRQAVLGVEVRPGVWGIEVEDGEHYDIGDGYEEDDDAW